MIKKIIMDKFCRQDPSGMTLMTPFVVNKKKKTLYLHIAKTGGSSITKILRENFLDDRFLTNKKKRFEEKKIYFEDIANNWDQYYKFTFIRNKYDLLVSNWHYDNRRLKISFKQFVKDIVVPNRDMYDYWIDQYYLTVFDGESIFDFIGRTENFIKDLKVPLKRIGINKYNSYRKVNEGKYDRGIPISNYYDEETKSLVDSKFKQEIIHFNFKV